MIKIQGTAEDNILFWRYWHSRISKNAIKKGDCL